jgi:tetratricopeptide (TPR) repeat protein
MMRVFVIACVLAWAVTAHAANSSYTFGEQRINLGWPHATADNHPHRIPSIADADYFNMNARYDLFLEQGKKHLKAGLKRAALEDLAQACSLEPYQPYVRRLLAHALMGIGDYAGAAEQLKRACHLSYNFQRLRIRWKEYSVCRAEYASDLDALRQACAREPQNPVLLYLLGVYRYFDEAYKESLLCLQEAQRLAPYDSDINYFVHAAKRERH